MVSIGVGLTLKIESVEKMRYILAIHFASLKCQAVTDNWQKAQLMNGFYLMGKLVVVSI
jgi:hypothetical protein